MFDFRRHDAFSFVVVCLYVMTGHLPYDSEADRRQLLDPKYVSSRVSAALENEGTTPECLVTHSPQWH